MLSKIRNGSLWPCYGMVPLAILGVMLGPDSSSVPFLGTAPHSTQVTFVNPARATSLRDGRTDYSVQFQLDQTSASTVNADNSAVALTSGCHNCGAFAIAFQVVVASSQSLATMNANNTANATSYACVSCSTLAEAYQIIDVSNTQPRLTAKQLAGLEYVRFQLALLRYSRLSSDQIQSKVADLASQAVALLQNSADPAPASGAPAVSPAVNGPAVPAVSGSAQPAQLTQPTQPGVQLFVKIQSA